MRMPDKMMVRLIVKIFLLANKGKWYTSRQLCDFINSNGLISGWGVAPSSLSRYLDKNYLNREGISRERKNSKNVWHYGVMLDG